MGQISKYKPAELPLDNRPHAPSRTQLPLRNRRVAKSTKCETHELAWYLPNSLPKTNKHIHTQKSFPYPFGFQNDQCFARKLIRKLSIYPDEEVESEGAVISKVCWSQGPWMSLRSQGIIGYPVHVVYWYGVLWGTLAVYILKEVCLAKDEQ